MLHLDHVCLPIGGYWILLDPEDVDRVMEHNWYPSSKGDYLQSTQNGEMVLLHRFIAGACSDDYTDHRNGNRWDNRKKNLRIATATQNARNARPHSNAASPFKGVSVVQRKSGPRFRALIQIDGKQKHLGYFKSEIEAARAYDAAARQHFGEFAWVNFDD
ncbi:HNH endonuclease [Epibacterium sp. MM17-32]|uniref:HNH endonuclease n=1 Tax=Epibacterium sp. MM17-32 TaxID=2917734 RepID=UPI001EF51123|nr:HNH endonuclease [Epibacterium sp. MM17-32]MCG7628964.1 HNH endonuclease [Epibacterium sp. MM17-32]